MAPMDNFATFRCLIVVSQPALALSRRIAMYKNILVAIDDSETSRCALKEALHIARTSNAKLYITHVADETLLSMHSRTVSTTLDFDQAVTAIADAGRKLLDEAMQAAAGVNAEPLLLEAMNRRVSKPWLKKPKHWMLT
jgi:nucleotide-binding universal stress UspA family protein